jgi:hypothetical protein
MTERLLSRGVATISDECRSQKIALIMAHQRVAQITSDNVKDALGNCAIGRAITDDAEPTCRAPAAPKFANVRNKLCVSMSKVSQEKLANLMI